MADLAFEIPSGTKNGKIESGYMITSKGFLNYFFLVVQCTDVVVIITCTFEELAHNTSE